MEIPENRFARIFCRFVCRKRLYLNGSRSKHLNVISLKRREFKLSIGGLNNIRCKSYRRFCNRRGLANFHYGAEGRSKGNGTNNDFPVNLYQI